MGLRVASENGNISHATPHSGGYPWQAKFGTKTTQSPCFHFSHYTQQKRHLRNDQLPPDPEKTKTRRILTTTSPAEDPPRTQHYHQRNQELPRKSARLREGPGRRAPPTTGTTTTRSTWDTRQAKVKQIITQTSAYPSNWHHRQQQLGLLNLGSHFERTFFPIFRIPQN